MNIHKDGRSAPWLSFTLSLTASCAVFLKQSQIAWEKLDTSYPLMSLISALYKSLKGYSIQAAAVLTAFYLLIRAADACKHNLPKQARFLCALMLAGLTLLGDLFDAHHSFRPMFASRILLCKYLIVFLGYLVLADCLLIIFVHAFNLWNRIPARIPSEDTCLFTPESICRHTLFFLLCWLPYLIVFYPCTSGSDAAGQLCQFYGLETFDYLFRSVGLTSTGGLTANQPLLHTILLGYASKLGALLGSQNIGIFLLILLQTALTAFAFAFSLCYTQRFSLSSCLRKRAAWLIALFPVFPLWAINLCKNSMAAPFFLIWLVLLTEIIRSGGAVLDRRGGVSLPPFKDWILFCLALWVCAGLHVLLLKTGCYVLLFTGVVFLVLFRAYRKEILIHLLLPVILVSAAQGLIIRAGQIATGGPQEALSLPIQQTVSYLLAYQDETSEEELQIVSKVLDIEDAKERYTYTSVDKVKDHSFRKECTKAERIAWLKVYVRWFFRHPLNYITSAVNQWYLFFYVNADTWFANKDFDTSQLKWKKHDYTTVITVSSPEALKPLRTLVWGGMEVLRQLPGIGLFLNGQIYQLIILACLLIALAKKDRGGLLCILPVFLNIGLCLLSPVGGHARYMLISIYSCPFILALMLRREK